LESSRFQDFHGFKDFTVSRISRFQGFHGFKDFTGDGKNREGVSVAKNCQAASIREEVPTTLSVCCRVEAVWRAEVYGL
jgi:hypothetical protein